MKDKVKEILDGFKEVLDNPTTSDECYDGRVIVIDRSYDLDLDEIKLLLDYITNLQEENKNLKQINEEHRKINGELRKTINEAIEYITTEQLYTNYQWGKSQYVKILKDLLEILQGKSDE